METFYCSLIALACAALIDWFIGDPPYLPHPVRFLGLLIAILEKKAARFCKSATGLRLAGALIVLIIAGMPALIILFLFKWAYLFHPAAGFILELYIYTTFFAGGDLRNHVLAVKKAFDDCDLGKVRKATSMLVSRQTEGLGEDDLSRATLESLFENSADGVIAPLFYAAIFGPSAIVFYKAVSTLDSMIGYKNKRYKNLGYAAARLDDLLNLIPARLSALLIIFAGAGRKKEYPALPVLWQNRYKHDSPNSAWPEAAAAGVLGLQFGGTDYHQGLPVQRPIINIQGRRPRAGDLAGGLKLYSNTVFLAYGIFIVLAWWIRTQEVFLY